MPSGRARSVRARSWSEGRRGDLARSLNNQSIHLAGLGRRKEALQAITEAVEVFRLMAAARSAVFRPDLAAALNNQIPLLLHLGRDADAAAGQQEARTLDHGQQTAKRWHRYAVADDLDHIPRCVLVLLALGGLHRPVGTGGGLPPHESRSPCSGRATYNEEVGGNPRAVTATHDQPAAPRRWRDSLSAVT